MADTKLYISRIFLSIGEMAVDGEHDVPMTNFFRADARQRGFKLSDQVSQLPFSLSVIVIGALSALSWALIIAIALAFHSEL